MSKQFLLDLLVNYRIYVTGVLDSNWVERHWGMTTSSVELNSEPDQKVLVSEVADQADLMGVFNPRY
jgi:hypothetical protein